MKKTMIFVMLISLFILGCNQSEDINEKKLKPTRLIELVRYFESIDYTLITNDGEKEVYYEHQEQDGDIHRFTLFVGEDVIHYWFDELNNEITEAQISGEDIVDYQNGELESNYPKYMFDLFVNPLLNSVVSESRINGILDEYIIDQRNDNFAGINGRVINVEYPNDNTVSTDVIIKEKITIFETENFMIQTKRYASENSAQTAFVINNFELR